MADSLFWQHLTAGGWSTVFTVCYAVGFVLGVDVTKRILHKSAGHIPVAVRIAIASAFALGDLWGHVGHGNALEHTALSIVLSFAIVLFFLTPTKEARNG